MYIGEFLVLSSLESLETSSYWKFSSGIHLNLWQQTQLVISGTDLVSWTSLLNSIFESKSHKTTRKHTKMALDHKQTSGIFSPSHSNSSSSLQNCHTGSSWKCAASQSSSSSEYLGKYTMKESFLHSQVAQRALNKQQTSNGIGRASHWIMATQNTSICI